MIPKYRGISVEPNDEEKWKYGYLIEDGKESFIINQVIEANEQYITIGSWYPVIPETVSQSTGLFDEIGEELFEGDVILWTYYDEFEDEGVAKIVFDNGMFKLLDLVTGEEVWNSLFDCIENCNVYLQGNIYKIPEPLEVE